MGAGRREKAEKEKGEEHQKRREIRIMEKGRRKGGDRGDKRARERRFCKNMGLLELIISKRGVFWSGLGR